MKEATLDRSVLDCITRDLHIARSFEDLLNSSVQYRPTIDVRNAAGLMLADAYDAAQEARSDQRRAFRRT
ncbi:MAG: hypothetical protein M0Z38_02050 [Deltaproteobacteria bacterium]|nr:hypothetical protein [Deltaproteobacteria bacterium]